jgi:hypothetical protein
MLCSSSYDVEVSYFGETLVIPTVSEPGGNCFCNSATSVVEIAGQVVIEFYDDVTVILSDPGIGAGIFDAKIHTSIGTCSATYTTSNAAKSSGGTGSNLGVIIGAAAGGVVVLIAIIAAVILVVLRRRRQGAFRTLENDSGGDHVPLSPVEGAEEGYTGGAPGGYSANFLGQGPRQAFG